MPMAEISAIRSERVTYGNGKFVAVGSNYIYTKESGQNWSSKTLEGASGMPDFQDIAFSSGVDSSSGICVAVGDKTLWWSEDGDNWTEVTSGRPNPLNGFFLSGVAADGAGHFVAVGSYKKPDNTNSGYLIWKSADGKSWTNVTNAAPALPASGIMHGVAYGDNTFVAVGGAGSEAWISNDLGSSWTTGEGTGSTMSGIAYGDGYFAGKAGSEILFLMMEVIPGRLLWKKNKWYYPSVSVIMPLSPLSTAISTKQIIFTRPIQEC